MKKLMSVLVAVSLVFAMFGCGGGGGGTGSGGGSGSGSGSGSTSPLAGTWDMSTQNGTAISGFTVTMVVNNDGSFSYTTTGAAKSPTGVQCAGSGTSSTNGSSLTRSYTANTCPETGKTVPYNETPAFSISGTTLTFTNGDGSIETWTKQSSSSTSPLAGTWNMATENGVAISGYTMTIVFASDGSFSYTTTGAAISNTGAQCAGSGTSSTSGSSVTATFTANNCPGTGQTVPYNETKTYSISGSTLTFIEGNGTTNTFTKQ